MSVELKIREALDDLATGPVPPDLADRALRGAARQRLTRLGTAVVVAVTALGLGAAGFVFLRGGDTVSSPSTPQPGTRPTTAPCVMFTHEIDGRPEVPREEWPGVVSAVVAALPEVSDYRLYSGYAWCTPDPSVVWEGPYGSLPVARANVDLGGEAERVVLSIDVHLATPGALADCAAAASVRLLDAPPDVCNESVGDGPMVFGGSVEPYAGAEWQYLWRTAVYPDGTTIALAVGGLFTGEQLEAAAMDPAVYASIPLSGSPFGS